MSEISKKEIEHVAGLARIRLSENEKEKMVRELGAILGYIDKLKEVHTDGVELIAHITGLENVLRKDLPSTTFYLSKVVLGELKKPLAEQAVEAVKLIEMAPDSKDNFVKVPAVFG